MGTEFEFIKTSYVDLFSWICLDKEYIDVESIDVETGVKQALNKLNNVIDALVDQVKELVQELRSECLKLHTLDDVYFIVNYLLTNTFTYYELEKLIWCKLRSLFNFEELVPVLNSVLNRLKHILSNESLPLKTCTIHVFDFGNLLRKVYIEITEEYGESVYLRAKDSEYNREKLINHLANMLSTSEEHALVPIPTQYIDIVKQQVFNKVWNSIIENLINW